MDGELKLLDGRIIKKIKFLDRLRDYKSILAVMVYAELENKEIRCGSQMKYSEESKLSDLDKLKKLIIDELTANPDKWYYDPNYSDYW